MARYSQFLLEKILFSTIHVIIFSFFFFSFLVPFPSFSMIPEIGYTGSSTFLCCLFICCLNFLQFPRRKEQHLGIANFYTYFITFVSPEYPFNRGTSWINASYSLHDISSLNMFETHHAWRLFDNWFHSVEEAAYALTQFRSRHICLLLHVAMHWAWLCIIILHLFWFMSGLRSEWVTSFLTFTGYMLQVNCYGSLCMQWAYQLQSFVMGILIFQIIHYHHKIIWV